MSLVEGRDDSKRHKHVYSFAGQRSPDASVGRQGVGEETSTSRTWDPDDIDDGGALGAWGVDEANQTFAVEFRKTTEIEGSTLLNSHYITATKKLLKGARLMNRSLGDPDEVPLSRHEQDWAKASAPVLRKLAAFRKRLQEHPGRQEDDAPWRTVLQGAVLDELTAFELKCVKMGWHRRYPEVQTAIDPFRNALRLSRGRESTTGDIERFCTSLDHLLNTVWAVDATRTSEMDVVREKADARLARNTQPAHRGP